MYTDSTHWTVLYVLVFPTSTNLHQNDLIAHNPQTPPPPPPPPLHLHLHHSTTTSSTTTSTLALSHQSKVSDPANQRFRQPTLHPPPPPPPAAIPIHNFTPTLTLQCQCQYQWWGPASQPVSRPPQKAQLPQSVCLTVCLVCLSVTPITTYL